MLELHGKSVNHGIAAGPVEVLKGRAGQVKKSMITDPEAEIARITAAGKKAKEQLRLLYQKAVPEVGQANAAIFEVQQMLLEDLNYLEAIYTMIRKEMVNAEYAAAFAGDHFSQKLGGMDDEYMKERAADIRDISSRLVRILGGKKEMELSSSEPVIVIAEDIAPSEAVLLDRKKILALVTVHGSTKSHTAILARMMNIPALAGVPLDLDEITDGTWALADGFQGTFVLEPSREQCSRAEAKKQEENSKLKLLQSLKGKENITRDGRRIRISANMGSPGDISGVLENDAGGIGLFRSEFLYLGREDLPGEDEQFQVYKQAAEKMAGRKTVIRTLDIGADKQADSFRLEQESNPAMGCRGIRVCLLQPEIFETQLRAIFRAAIFGNLAVMYPMITSAREVSLIKEIVQKVKGNLEEAGQAFKIPEQGIMIETPAAALISDELAQMVDFFSIGTNDLAQYTLAVDRQNEKLDEFFDPHHKAVLRLIRMTVENAHQYGRRVGICGELAADMHLTETFIRMGVDELSVIPSMVLKLRKRVRELDLKDIKTAE